MTDLMRFVRPTDDSWADVFTATEKIYDGPSAVVAKPTRFGFTSSFAKISERNNDRLLIISPTNKLFETIKKAADSAIQVYGHGYCKIRAEREDQFLNKFWTSLPPTCPADGTNCDEAPGCMLKIAWYESRPVRMITYAKLIPVAFLYSAENELIRDQLKDVTHIMLDESHILSLDNLPSADLNHSIKNIPLEFDYLRKVYFDFCDLINELREDDIIKQLDLTRNHLKSESFLSFKYENTKMVDRTLQTHAFSDVKRLAENRESLNFSEEDILYLADVINVMTCDCVSANLITSNAGDKYLVTGKPTANSPTIKNAIKLFLKEICPNAKVFFVSGSQFEKYPGFFEEIAGRPLANICVPDVKHNNAKMTIIPDTWEYSTIIINGTDLSGKSDERIKNHILDILVEHPGEPIYIICFNKKLQAKIIKWKLQLPPGSLIDYYRSPDSIGIECNARIGIAIGIANNPSNTYDYATENVADSRSLRYQSVHSATWQAWSRIKDPEGKVPSTLYCIGVRSDDVSAVVRQGSNRTVIYNGKDKNNRNIPPTITVSEELPRPKIMMEAKAKQALEPNNMTSDSFIDCIVPLEDRIIDEAVDMRLISSSVKNPDISHI